MSTRQGRLPVHPLDETYFRFFDPRLETSSAPTPTSLPPTQLVLRTRSTNLKPSSNSPLSERKRLHACPARTSQRLYESALHGVFRALSSPAQLVQKLRFLHLGCPQLCKSLLAKGSSPELTFRKQEEALPRPLP